MTAISETHPSPAPGLLLEAGDPATQPERLCELATRDFPDEVRRLVAANPNTPWVCLQCLIIGFPREFARNPILPLLFLENAGWVETLTEEQAGALLCVDDMPGALLEGLQRREDADTLGVPLHVQAGGEAGDGWKEEAELALQNRMALTLERAAFNTYRSPSQAAPGWENHPLLEEAKHSVLTALLYSANPGYRQFGATLPGARPLIALLRRAGASTNLRHFAPCDTAMSAEELERLAGHGPWPRILVARHPNTDGDTLQQLAATEKSGAVAHNPHATARALRILSSHAKPEIRQAVARHPNTDSATLKALACDRSCEVQRAVSRNPQTPPETLTEMAASTDSFMRGGVAANRSTCIDVLEKLAKDIHPAVRRDLARNPRAPQAALEILSRDSDAQVLAILLRRPGLPPSLQQEAQHNQYTLPAASHSSEKPQNEISHRRHAASSNASPQTLGELSRDPDFHVRVRVAANRRTPGAVLEALSKESDSLARRTVAANPSAPPHVLANLAADSDRLVHRPLASNPSTPPQVLSEMVQRQAHLREGFHPALAANPSLPQEMLEPLARQLIEPVPDSRLSDSYSNSAGDANREAALIALLKSRRSSPELKEKVQVTLQEIGQERWHKVLSVCLQPGGHWDRILTLSQETAPADELQKQLYSFEWLWRYAVARNASAPLDLLEKLTHDGNRYVRAAAREAYAQRTVKTDT